MSLGAPRDRAARHQARRVWPYVAEQFNKLISNLSAEEAIAVGAHFALGVSYMKVAAYLGISPKQAQRLASCAVREMRTMIRTRNLRVPVDDVLVPGHFTAAHAAACPLITWLAEEFHIEIALAPFIAWSLELFVGNEVRPCQDCGDPMLFDLERELGRPRYYCSNACRQKAYRRRRVPAVRRS
ncbi:hypothetical protein AB0L53_09535 [Nonomuraea sp. NPDC052129]|uniref:hypothetical protein n=1 Tax=Nonomuraea sp. NPDC052129 TaxID=3154651 RepID=UPI0034313F3C